MSACSVQSVPAARPEAPKEFTTLLNQANQRLKAEADEAQAQASEIRNTQDQGKETQSQINTFFQKGKLLYYQGKYEAAVEEWDKITPLLGDSNKDAADLIETLKENYQATQEAKKAA